METLPYRKLRAWEHAYSLANDVLDLLDTEPLRREFSVRDQMLRAATSVPANIAEGHGRGTNRDFASYIDRARGSLFELDNWLQLARDRAWLNQSDFERLAADVNTLNGMLFGLRNRLLEKATTDPRRRS